jgi:hypothetical protein
MQKVEHESTKDLAFQSSINSGPVLGRPQIRVLFFVFQKSKSPRKESTSMPDTTRSAKLCLPIWLNTLRSVS